MTDDTGGRPAAPLVRELPEADEPLVAPRRPALVELAAAILIVGGSISIVGAVGAAGGLPAGSEPLLLVTLALNVGTVAVGLLARSGRGWLLAINYVAVLAFLDLLAAGGSGIALLLGVAEVLALVILFSSKRWFDAKAQERAARR